MAWDAKSPQRSQLLRAAGMNPGPVHFNIRGSYYFAKFGARAGAFSRPPRAEGQPCDPVVAARDRRADVRLRSPVGGNLTVASGRPLPCPGTRALGTLGARRWPKRLAPGRPRRGTRGSAPQEAPHLDKSRARRGAYLPAPPSAAPPPGAGF